MAVSVRKNGSPFGCWVILMVAFAGCEGPPAAASLTEWTADDHHSTDDGKLTGRAPAQPSAAGGARRDDAANVAQLVDLTWRQQCTSCHGEAGKGDGRMGPMLQAPDLTRAEWQGRVSDAELAATIKSGKNKMPKFDLPEPVVAGLVARIRLLRGR